MGGGCTEVFWPRHVKTGPLFGEIKDMLNRFNNFEVQQVGREGNVIAHNLARHAQYVNDMVMWWFSTPDLVKKYVCVDAMLAS